MQCRQSSDECQSEPQRPPVHTYPAARVTASTVLMRTRSSQSLRTPLAAAQHGTGAPATSVAVSEPSTPLLACVRETTVSVLTRLLHRCAGQARAQQPRRKTTQTSRTCGHNSSLPGHTVSAPQLLPSLVLSVSAVMCAALGHEGEQGGTQVGKSWFTVVVRKTIQ